MTDTDDAYILYFKDMTAIDDYIVFQGYKIYR